MFMIFHDYTASKLVFSRLHPQCQIPEALNDLPEEICTEILEDANAHDLLRSIYPNRRRRRQDDWLVSSPSNSPTNGWSDSDPSWIGKDNTPGPDAWSSDAWPGEQRTPKNPFKFSRCVRSTWPCTATFRTSTRMAWPATRTTSSSCSSSRLEHLVAFFSSDLYISIPWTVHEQSMNSLWTVYISRVYTDLYRQSNINSRTAARSTRRCASFHVESVAQAGLMFFPRGRFPSATRHTLIAEPWKGNTETFLSSDAEGISKGDMRTEARSWCYQ